MNCPFDDSDKRQPRAGPCPPAPGMPQRPAPKVVPVATDERPDFDVMSLLSGPMNMVSGVMGVAENARKTVGGMLEAIAALQRAAKGIEQLATRLNKLVDDIEIPMRAMTPEFEKAVARMQRLSEAFEGPLDRLVPGIETAIGTLDRLSINQLPENLEQVRAQMMAIVDVFAEVPRRLGSLADLVPGMDRLRALAAPGWPGGPVRPPARANAPAIRNDVAVGSASSAAGAGPAATKPPAVGKPVPKKTVPKKAVPKRAVAKQAVAKRAVAKRAVAKQAVAKQSARSKLRAK